MNVCPLLLLHFYDRNFPFAAFFNFLEMGSSLLIHLAHLLSSRLSTFPKDLPIHAIGLYLWDLVSMSWFSLDQKPKVPLKSSFNFNSDNPNDFLCSCSSLHGASGTQKICITLEPALLLKGDVMVSVASRSGFKGRTRV